MGEFYASYVGHTINARRAVVELDLVKESELAYMSDNEVKELINKSQYILFKKDCDWGLIPKELEDRITWICR